MAERTRSDLASVMWPAPAREAEARAAALEREVAEQRAADLRREVYRAINARSEERRKLTGGK